MRHPVYRYSFGGYEGDQLAPIIRQLLNDADAHPLRRVPLRELVGALQQYLTVWEAPTSTDDQSAFLRARAEFYRSGCDGLDDRDEYLRDALNGLASDAADDLYQALALLIAQAAQVDDYKAACEVLPDSLDRPLAARIQLVLENARRESHIGCELRRELDGGIERDACAIEAQWPEAARFLRSHAHIEDGV